MPPRFLPLQAPTRQKRIRLQQEAERAGASRWARRLPAVLLKGDGDTSGQIAALLAAPRSCLSVWLASDEENGGEGLPEGAHRGRAPAWDLLAQRILTDLLDRGPVAYGFLAGGWTSPRVAGGMAQEFGIHFHTSPVGRVLQQLGFSVQRPQGLLACAEALEQARGRPPIYPGSKACCRPGAAWLLEDEASFRQDATRHQTWARQGCPPRVPTTGARKRVKVFGCVEIDSARFFFHYEPVLNAQTYLRLGEPGARAYSPRPVHYLHDRASYHRDSPVEDWLHAQRRWWPAQGWPQCSPEHNAAEP